MEKGRKVLIAGAGPTGLALALWLKKRGIEFRLVDKADGPGTTSRALAIQARTLEFYRQLGIEKELLAAGVIAKEITMRRRGKIVAVAKLGALGEGMSPFPYLLFCSQDVHEKILCRELARLGTDVEWKTELVSFRETKGSVKAKLRSEKGLEEAEFGYLVGADGAHSVVRHGLGLEFPGGTYSQLFFVADVETKEKPKPGVQLCMSPKDFCIVMPIKQTGSVRFTGIVPKKKESKQEVSFTDVEESVMRNTGLHPEKVNWFSTYHVHHRVVEHFRLGKVFLAGDAAHIHSPAGGQGMNTGIGDAVNLAWKLSDVIEERADDRLLDSFEAERIAFARSLVSTTDTAFRFVANRSPLGSLFRAYFLPGAFFELTRMKSFLRFAFRTVSQIRIQYRKSPLSQGGTAKRAAGDRLPWVRVGKSDNFPLGIDWEIHTYGNGKKPKLSFTAFPHRHFPLNGEAKKKGLLAAVYAIRPDGHIGYVGEERGLAEYFSEIGYSL